MGSSSSLARQFWEAIEPLHAVVYFATEPAQAAESVGLRGWWMGYFAGRFAPLGPLLAEPATSMAFGFAPRRVERALPDAWRRAAPAEIVATRTQAVCSALTRCLPDAMNGLDELCDLLERAVAGCQFDGRPLAAGWSAVSSAGLDTLAKTWLATSVLREHRGDGHVLAAVNLGLSGIDANITHVGTGLVTRDQLQTTRGWTDTEWQAALLRLATRGLVDSDGRLTSGGSALRAELESATDRLAEAPIERLGRAGVERTIALAAPLSRRLVDTNAVPVPNPIGAPRP